MQVKKLDTMQTQEKLPMNQHDTATTPSQQSRWQRWQMKPRDRRERLANFMLAFVASLAAYVLVRWALAAGWPIWLAALTVLAIGSVASACWCLWYKRRTPVTAAG